jgi:hypothetical protein
MIDMNYQQIDADHTIFSQQHGGHITMLVMYVNNMIITENDEGEITRLKVRLGKILG